jgi:hypothetical protein
MITISSDEELSYSLYGFTQGNILRLTASIYDGVNTEPTHAVVGTDQQIVGRECNQFRGRGRCEQKQENRGFRWEKKKEKMNMRREMIKETINDMTKKQEQGQLTPHQVQHLAMLQDKLRRLDSILLNWDEKVKEREQWWKEKTERKEQWWKEKAERKEQWWKEKAERKKAKQEKRDDQQEKHDAQMEKKRTPALKLS